MFGMPESKGFEDTAARGIVGDFDSDDSCADLELPEYQGVV